ncbi:ribosome maturation factor RimP [Mycobacterium sp. M1]|uniref:Ribosome maturation factor RimP n=1 Tax=Mycolicibacter acidiphilus TaxID=2835306 RepID=A0ABS5RIW8_9MYCO|nr:ribosome maturation factor RimP [Mycolicibacter acidiphilus]MBS9534149.1 ribosome maturation factor RimP [Mycolicibacter acidiphilus]
MATGLPSQTQVIELLDPEFARAGYEIEDVFVDTGVTPPRITVIADGDIPLDLDTVAALSRSASTLLDGLDFDSEYILEVSSPGVGRPLTSAKHFRRARGRKVAVSLRDGGDLTGRVAAVDGDSLTLVVRSGREWVRRQLALSDVTQAVVQVEFSAPSEHEMELVDRQVQDAGTETGR